MSSKSMFSILVPVYNAKKYLPECLKSIENQSYRDFEVVLVDDGSTDGSGEICDEWASRHEGCRVVHTPNRGLFLSRRMGFECAMGRYCIPLDADDTLRSDALSVIFDTVQEYEPDIIAFSSSRTRDYENGKNGIPAGYHCGQCLELRRAACSGYANNLCGKAFKRSVVRDALGSFEPLENSSFAEDWAQLLSIVGRASSCCSINECLYWYRPNEASTVHVFDARHIAGLDRAFGELDRFSGEWGSACHDIADASKINHAYGLLTILLSSVDSFESCNADELRKALVRWEIECLKPINIAGRFKKEMLLLFSHRHSLIPRISVIARSVALRLMRAEG